MDEKLVSCILHSCKNVFSVGKVKQIAQNFSDFEIYLPLELDWGLFLLFLLFVFHICIHRSN